MALNDIYRVVLNAAYYDVEVQNVLHLRVNDGSFTAQSICQLVKDELTGFVQSTHVNAFRWHSTFAQNMSSNQSDTFLQTFIEAIDGNYNEQGVPPVFAMVSSLRTGYFGRSRKGRIYWTGFPLSFIEGGRWSGGGILGFRLYFDVFFNKFKYGGSNQVVEFGMYSKKLGGGSFPYGQQGFAQCTEYIIGPKVGTMRTRLA